MTVNIAWGIRSAVCANEFIDDFVSYVSLSLLSSTLTLMGSPSHLIVSP